VRISSHNILNAKSENFLRFCIKSENKYDHEKNFDFIWGDFVNNVIYLKIIFLEKLFENFCIKFYFM
jgi:hypothetical protein